MQIRQQILDLFALIELQPVDDLIRDAAIAEGVFDRSRQRVHPAHDREISRFGIARDHLVGDLIGDAIGFFVTVLVLTQRDRFAGRVIGEQILLFATAVVPNQLIGDAKDFWRAAVVLFQPNGFDRRVILFEIQNVVEVGATPSVDRLIGVTRHGEVGMVDRKRSHDGVLSQVCVLVLVDHDVLELLVQVRSHLGVFPQQPSEVEEQIIKVDRVGGQQLLLISGVISRFLALEIADAICSGEVWLVDTPAAATARFIADFESDES